MADPAAIAQQFLTQYYQAFETNRETLAGLYRPESVLMFEGAIHQGPEAIGAKFKSLPMRVVQHAVTTTDALLTPDGGLMIMVLGQLKADDDPVHTFSETFYLKQIGDSLFIMSQMFRLSLHHTAS